MNRERPILFSGPMVNAILKGHKTQTRRVVKPRGVLAALWLRVINGHEMPSVMLPHCPFGKVGDKLWVRETHAESLDSPQVLYRADWYGNNKPPKWKPSIFMRRWASRILLEIVSVRIERLDEISEDDAEAEGCSAITGHWATDQYQTLWEEINGKGSWKDNPFVWVVEFKVLKPKRISDGPTEADALKYAFTGYKNRMEGK